MIDEFNDSQTEVKVIAVQQPYQDYDANLLQAIRNGVGPDICSRFATNVADYIADDLLVDFGPYLADKKIGIANFKDNLAGDLYLILISATGKVISPSNNFVKEYPAFSHNSIRPISIQRR